MSEIRKKKENKWLKNNNKRLHKRENKYIEGLSKIKKLLKVCV